GKTSVTVTLSGGNDEESATLATVELEGVTFTANAEGEAGNGIKIVFEDPGENEAELTISVSDRIITVTLATDENGNIISTAADIVSAIDDHDEASNLVTASVGTEAVSIGGKTSVTVTLSGGNDGAVNVTTQTGANEAIQTIQDALDKVSGERSKLGALQNRLEHTINNLSVAAENLTAAESRIRDVDMAKEMMEFTKNQILIQAGTAMLANANVRPQSVLQLLG
ncbi:MAG: flagellin, partial [bacterium]